MKKVRDEGKIFICLLYRRHEGIPYLFQALSENPWLSERYSFYALSNPPSSIVILDSKFQEYLPQI